MKIFSSHFASFALVAICLVLAPALIQTKEALAGSSYPRCFVGTYLVEEGSGTRSLWTFGTRGTLIITSSAQKALNFSTEQGAWRKSGSRRAKAVTLDFSLDDDGELLNIARVDADIRFEGHRCSEMVGDFTLRFFDPSDDPLNPEPGNGETITDTFTGRRINIE